MKQKAKTLKSLSSEIARTGMQGEDLLLATAIYLQQSAEDKR